MWRTSLCVIWLITNQSVVVRIIIYFFDIVVYLRRKDLIASLQWRHNGLKSKTSRLYRHRSKKISKLLVTCFCEGKSSGTGGFPAQKASNAENVSIGWRHHDSREVSNQLCRSLIYELIQVPSKLLRICLTATQYNADDVAGYHNSSKAD